MAGRKRKYSEQELITKGTILFWKKGFENCSTQEIMAELDINKGTLYQTFGSKEKFFVSCLKNAEDEWMLNFTKEISESDHPLELIKELLVANCKESEEKRSMGCILGNTLMESSNGNQVLKKLSLHYLESLRKLFEKALTKGQKLGHINDHIEPGEGADILLNLWNGINLTKRMNRSSNQLENIVTHTLLSLQIS